MSYLCVIICCQIGVIMYHACVLMCYVRVIPVLYQERPKRLGQARSDPQSTGLEYDVRNNLLFCGINMS